MARKYWIDIGSNWNIYFDNAKTYIRSPTLVSRCSYSRAFLSPNYGDVIYRNRLYAFVLAASVNKKQLKIVLDDTQDKSLGNNLNCEYFGADVN